MISTAEKRGSRVLIQGLTKSYSGEAAVDSIDLDINPGEFMTLLGPSGSGKTTTLNMVAGFVEPDSGTLSIDNLSLLGMPARKRGIGMVFQNYALFPHMTVAENIAFPLRQRNVPRGERRAKV